DLPQRHMVLTQVTVDDGQDLGDPAFVSPNLLTSYTYENGAFDRHEKEFLGFETVTTTRPDGAQTIQVYENRDYTQKGVLKSETFQDKDGRIFSRTINTYVNTPIVTGSAEDPGCEGELHPLLSPQACDVLFPALVQVEMLATEGGDLSQAKSHKVTMSYDRFG